MSDRVQKIHSLFNELHRELLILTEEERYAWDYLSLTSGIDAAHHDFTELRLKALEA